MSRTTNLTPPDDDAEAAKGAVEGSDPMPPLNPVEALIARMEAHNAEGDAIDGELTRLGLTRKKVNSILSTKARIAKEEALLANLTGATG